MELSTAQDTVIASMIRTMAHKKTKEIFVVLNQNSVVRLKNKMTYAQINYLENGAFKLRLRTHQELFDPVEIRTLKVLVEKKVLVLDAALSKGNQFVYRWDYGYGQAYPMTESIKAFLLTNEVWA